MYIARHIANAHRGVRQLRDRLHFAFDPPKRIGLSSDTCNAPKHGKTRAMQGPGRLPSDAWTDVFHDASSKVGAGSVRSAKLRSFLTVRIGGP